MDRIAVYAGTRNLYYDMVTAAKSLLYHDGADRVYFLIEDDVFPSAREDLPDCISCINVSGQTFFKPDGPNYASHWTYMVLMRVAISKMPEFARYDRVLTLDHDTIVRKPIDALWNLDMGHNYYAAVKESRVSRELGRPYYNFGVVMHNIRRLRDGTDDTIIRTINAVRLRFNEQDAVNSVCRGHIMELPVPYNVMWFNTPSVTDKDIIIHHYAASHFPLRDQEDYKQYERMTWQDVLQHREVIHNDKV